MSTNRLERFKTEFNFIILDYRYALLICPALFLYIFSNDINIIALYGLIYRKICLNQFNETICNSLKDYPAFSNIVQEKSSHKNIELNVAFLVPAIFAIIQLASIGDRRRNYQIPLIIALIGSLGQAFINIFAVSQDYTTCFVLLVCSQIVNGLCGGGSLAFISSCFSHIAVHEDKVNTVNTNGQKYRSIRYSICESSLLLGQFLGSFSSGYLIGNKREIYKFQQTYIVSFCVYLFVFLYTIIMFKYIKKKTGGSDESGHENTAECKETDALNSEQIRVDFSQNKVNLGKKIKNQFKFLGEAWLLLSKPRDKNRRFLIVSILVLFYFACSVSLGIISLQYLYLIKKPISLTQIEYGIYKASSTLCRAISLLVILPILKRYFQIADYYLLVIGLTSEFLNLIVFTVAAEITWFVWLGPISYMCSNYFAVCVRSYASKLVDKNETGKVFGLVGVTEFLVLLTSSSAFSLIYKQTVSTFPSLVFIIGCGICILICYPFLIWPKDYTYESAKALENYWRPQLEKCQESYSNSKKIKENLPKKYVLSMFPYPSGRLHLGHVRVYTLNDVLARYNRLRGFYVINPIGFDSFGLPAENAAIERKIEPDKWTDSNVEYMKNQLKELSLSFDWNRELSTCRPSYYKWTQYLFLQMYQKGIVFKKEALVNWDPVDKTVLANEQIDENGKSWRSGAQVEKKILKQWFIKSSAYAKSLMDSMDSLSTDDWEIVKNIQKMWIGNCNGCFIDFDLEYEDSSLEKSILSVFTETPQGLYGISHININKNHLILKNLNLDMEENDQLPCNAVNPFTGDKIPIFLKNESEFGTLNSQGVPYVDAKLSIPSLDQNEREFATKFGLKFKNILQNEKLINSDKFNGQNFTDAFKSACEELLKVNRGGHITSDRLNDWCISRQRYWGCPIPLVYCEKCEVVPVPVDQLPVELPKMENFQKNLKKSNWHHTECPSCRGPAVRETDTMDTFMDSSWYYLRYLDVENEYEPFSTEVAMKEMPVDIYIGGVEHAMTHLFVSRLICHFLYDLEKLPAKEPFQRFIAMGMVKGETFKTKNGRYVQAQNVIEKNDKFYCSQTNEELKVDFEKMSKSKLNGIDPQDMIQKYGVDFTRLFLLSFVHPKSDRNFIMSSDMVNGTMGIFQKLWELVGKACTELETNGLSKSIYRDQKISTLKNELYNVRNSQLSMINHNLNENFNLPSYLVAFSKIIKFLKKYSFEQYDEDFYKLLVETLVIASPVIPHFTSECWSRIKKNKFLEENFDLNKMIIEQKWPEVDSNWMLDLNLNVNGKNALFIKIKANEIEKLNEIKAIEYFQQTNSFEKKLKKSLDYYDISLKVKPFLKATLYLKEKHNKNQN
ncbi:putative leucine--tRNA mitochondrial [Brachionus plicatilis]|uniref:leucine--tRNA ligase n=1 Tax=Brachionus plicatilis TaxID=10195 RepID=A0A3M7SXC7_BRAPC|nr:putative leucine--tRNA mitochondrial [Brachionus plicatilis]